MNKEQLQFFYDEVMGLFGWGDEEEETGVDPLTWAKSEIGMKDKQLFAARQAILAGGIVEGQLRAEVDSLTTNKDKWADAFLDLQAEVEKWKTAERLALETVAQLRAELDKKDAALNEVICKAQALLDKMNAVYECPQYNGAFILYQEHFGDYKKNGGMQWTDEQDDLAAWLSAHPQEEK